MGEYMLHDIIWDSDSFTVLLQETDLCDVQVDFDPNSCEFSEKPSRPSKSLVDMDIYKKVIEIKDKIPQINNWKKSCKLSSPYDKISNISKLKKSKEYYKFIEIFKFFEIEISKNNVYYYSPNKTADNTINDVLEVFYDGVKFVDNGMVDICISNTSVDFSHDPNNQEQLSFFDISKNVIDFLGRLNKSGVMIIRFYDTLTRPTCQLLSIITRYFESVYFIKPRTSRYTNSEKYLVCINFKGICNKELVYYQDFLKIYTTTFDENHFCRKFGNDNGNLVTDFDSILYDYNKKLLTNQYDYILKTLKTSYNEDDISEKHLEAFQNKKAIEFCNNFDIPILDIDTFSKCKHNKKTKSKILIKNCIICDKCYSLIF